MGERMCQWSAQYNNAILNSCTSFANKLILTDENGCTSYSHAYLFFLILCDLITFLHHNDIMIAKVNPTVHGSLQYLLEHNLERLILVTMHMGIVLP